MFTFVCTYLLRYSCYHWLEEKHIVFSIIHCLYHTAGMCPWVRSSSKTGMVCVPKRGAGPASCVPGRQVAGSCCHRWAAPVAGLSFKLIKSLVWRESRWSKKRRRVTINVERWSSRTVDVTQETEWDVAPKPRLCCKSIASFCLPQVMGEARPQLIR